MTNSLPAQATHTNTSQSTVSLKTQAGSPKLDILKALQRYRIVDSKNRIVDDLCNLGLMEAEHALCRSLNLGADCYLQDEEPAYQNAFVVVNSGVHQGQAGFVVEDLKDNYLYVKFVMNGCHYVFIADDLDFVGEALSCPSNGVEAIIQVVGEQVNITTAGECYGDLSQINEALMDLYLDGYWPDGFVLNGTLYIPEKLPAFLVVSSELSRTQKFYITHNGGGFCVDEKTGKTQYNNGTVIFDTLRV